jgi:hypothetical protein
LTDALTLRSLVPADGNTDTINIAISLGLFLVALTAWLLRQKRLARVMTFVFAGWVTIGLLVSVFALIYTMPKRAAGEAGFAMLFDAVIIWVVNILIFSVWYWLVDSGGIEQRIRKETKRRDLIFPQQANDFPGWFGWRPAFLDYIFLAFNNSTAFSPTDTFILTHRLKLLTMLQAAISLISLATLAAYAINLMAR